MLSNSLDRACQVSESMEARGFGSGNKRTFYRDISVTPFDFATIILGLSPLILAICLVVPGYADYGYYPTLSKMALSSCEWAMLLTIMVFTCAPALVSPLKRRFDLD
jgi:hypothetical protein